MSKGYIEFISGEAFSGKTSLMLKKIAVAGGKSRCRPRWDHVYPRA